MPPARPNGTIKTKKNRRRSWRRHASPGPLRTTAPAEVKQLNPGRKFKTAFLLRHVTLRVKSVKRVPATFSRVVKGIRDKTRNRGGMLRSLSLSGCFRFDRELMIVRTFRGRTSVQLLRKFTGEIYCGCF